jgi:hypothetical protein
VMNVTHVNETANAYFRRPTHSTKVLLTAPR